MSATVSWLEERLNALQKLSQLHSDLKLRRRDATQLLTDKTTFMAIEDSLKELRQKMLAETAWLVEQIAKRAGIELAFVAHEGLVMAASGQSKDCEAYAAIANSFASDAADTSKRLGLEAPNQVLLIARNRKLALIFVEGMILGIVAPRATELSTLLSRA